MDQLAQSRTASVLTALSGAWLALSPIWISVSDRALTSLFVVAGVFFVFGLWQLFTENSAPSWIVALGAIYLFVSAFGFTSLSTNAVWNETITAAVAFVLAIWDSVEISQVHQRHIHAT